MDMSLLNSVDDIPDSPDTIKGDTNPDVNFEDCLFYFVNPNVAGYNYLHLVAPSFYHQAASSLGKNPSVISVIEYLCCFTDLLNRDYDIIYAVGSSPFNDRVEVIRLHKFNPTLDYEKLFNYKVPPISYPAVDIIYDAGLHHKNGVFC